MDIATNSHSIQKRIDYALANLKQNAPDLSARMSWHWTDVVMSTRLRRVAGRCWYWRKTDELKLEFSEALFNSFPEMEKTDTVVHELAHAVCFRLSLDKGHGSEFKRVCRLMGGSGERCCKVEAGVVKHNLVKRWVCVKKNEPSKIYLRTKRQANDFIYAVKDPLVLGVISVDKNSKTVKWLQVDSRIDASIAAAIRSINPLQGKYNLVA